MSINLNDQVKVTLTEYGKEIIKNYYNVLLKHMPQEDIDRSINKAIENGKFSLWDLMNIFGQYTYIGNPRIPFENNVIEIVKPEKDTRMRCSYCGIYKIDGDGKSWRVFDHRKTSCGGPECVAF